MPDTKSRDRGFIFFTSIGVVLFFVLLAFFRPEQFGTAAEAANAYIISTFGWFYLGAGFVFLIFCIYLAFGPYSQIKLGQDDDEPDYKYFSWLAMLFSAGMGIGLVFYGVAEPMMHFQTPPDGIEGETTQAARIALRYSFFHWGLHPWAIYTMIGLTIAYTQFRKVDHGGLIAATFRPLLGRHVDRWPGKAIDTFATIATAVGVATSLGLGATQINGGISHLTGIENNVQSQIGIILVVTVLFMISAATGLNKGILYLSNLNLTIAGSLLLFVFLFGPTGFIMETFTTTFGDYIGNVIQMSFHMTPFTGSSWTGDWTIFYWAWWIAWAPFVGAFIARISRGRTIQEFVINVLLVPTVLGALWFSVFGGAGIHLDLFENKNIGAAVTADINSALFVMLDEFPAGMFLTAIATLLIITFFVTSADSATFVLGMLSTGGSLNPTLITRIIWGILQSSIAAALLISGGLGGLQTASIVAALPFAVVLIAMVFSLKRGLKEDLEQMRREDQKERKKFKEWEAKEEESSRKKIERKEKQQKKIAEKQVSNPDTETEK